MYQNHAFGDAQLKWGDALVEGRDAFSTLAEATAWLQAGQQRLRQSIAALYHAGEINHIRALHQQNDG